MTPPTEEKAVDRVEEIRQEWLDDEYHSPVFSRIQEQFRWLLSQLEAKEKEIERLKSIIPTNWCEPS